VCGPGDGNRGVGHVAIAISNYKEVKERVKENGKWTTKSIMVPDGTYTVRDLWPGIQADKTNFAKNLPAAFSLHFVGVPQFSQMEEMPAIKKNREPINAPGYFLLVEMC
jgi:hypothetical protein